MNPVEFSLCPVTVYTRHVEQDDELFIQDRFATQQDDEKMYLCNFPFNRTAEKCNRMVLPANRETKISTGR
ncbi:MAG TPA: hypothetical protein DHV48_02775 [Prolixibacteraceae bacterium]|nr:hypothetical protein [Prolixibacteraceae bacterium]